ncbi:MAG: thiamine phosphate synthase [Rikenellaceae bacterium]
MEITKLQYISDGDLVSIEQYLKGGGRWVQLRMKNKSPEEIVKTGIAVRELSHKYGATYILNDNPMLAHLSGADGVHLGKSDGITTAARMILGDNKIIGRTAHTIEDIVEITKSKVDYIGVGALRETATKSNIAGVLGYEGYRDIIKALPLNIPPIIAIGGVVLEDIHPLLEIGVYGIAVSALISKSTDIKQTTINICNELR